MSAATEHREHTILGQGHRWAMAASVGREDNNQGEWARQTQGRSREVAPDGAVATLLYRATAMEAASAPRPSRTPPTRAGPERAVVDEKNARTRRLSGVFVLSAAHGRASGHEETPIRWPAES